MDEPYGHSQGSETALISLDPDGDLRLDFQPFSEEPFPGHHLLPPLGSTLPSGQVAQWKTLPFTPHHRTVRGYLHHSPMPHPVGTKMTPGEALKGLAEGTLFFDAPTFRVLKALTQTQGANQQQRIALEKAFASEPEVHPVGPFIDLIPLRTPTIPPASHTNCYAIGDKNLVIVDPASPYPEEQERLFNYLSGRREMGATVSAIFLTHHHPDHIGGAQILREKLGCPIYAHKITRNLLANQVTVDETLKDGQLLVTQEETKLKLRAIFTPGHAPGHLCLHDELSGALIAGDMVAGWGSIIVEYTEGDMGLYLESLNRLNALAPRIVLPSHGPPTLGKVGLISRFINHRLARESQILAALSKTVLKPDALLEAIYSAIPAFLKPAAGASLIAHLLKLEREGKVRLDLDGNIHLVTNDS